MEPPSAAWSTIEEPPAIRSFQEIHRDRSRNRTVKGSFAPLARLHSRIESEFTYDPAIARFTPKNPLGAAGETLDAVHAAKEKAEKSGIYEKMASGDPNDVFDAAENFGKIFTQLAEGVLAPKKILPTYKLLVDDAKPPHSPRAEGTGHSRRRQSEDVGHAAEASVPHPQSRRPVHLRACRRGRPGHRPARLIGRPADDSPPQPGAVPP